MSLLNEAKAVDEVAERLRQWWKRLKKKTAYTHPSTGKAVFKDVPDPAKYITEQDRDATREVFTVVGRRARLLRRLLNDYGCHEYTRPKLTSLLDLASRAEIGEDVGGYWCRAAEYAGPHEWAGPCSVPDELAKWAKRLRAEAAAAPGQDDGQAAAKAGAGAGDGGSRRPPVTWQEARDILLGFKAEGLPYDSIKAMADRARCGVATAQKAFKKCSDLQNWQAKYKPAPSPAPRAHSLNPVVMDNMVSHEPDPADAAAENEHLDATFHRLLNEATPQDRAKLNAKTEAEQRELARQVIAQRKEQHIEDEARNGNRLLGRKA